MDLTAFDYSSYADLRRDMVQSGDDVIFRLDGTTVTVMDTTRSDFSEADFIL